MASPEKIAIEIVYAMPQQQTLLRIEVDAGCSVETAIYASNILATHPDIDLGVQKVGIFSKICDLGTTLKAGDRVEIYRPLTIDPKEARRLRAKKHKKSLNSSNKPPR
jgi:putative ubiquitin-RnfH superfamily antitoxin RatB of RatAB toxin-antitoxin module